jgi:hypothetical protein
MAHLIPDNLKSRADVSAPIRRVASAFQVALDESVICWFEPLFDPEGQKPHFVVLLPEQGIAVFEVLDLKSDTFLGAFRGRVRFLRDGREIEVENPLVRADTLCEKLKARLLHEPRLRHLQIPVKAGAIFPSLTAEEARKKGGESIIKPDCSLFKDEIDAAIAGTGETALLRKFTRILGAPAEQTTNPEAVNILRGLIQPEIVIERIGQSQRQAPGEVRETTQETAHRTGHGTVEGNSRGETQGRTAGKSVGEAQGPTPGKTHERPESQNQLQIFAAPQGEEDIIRVMDLQQETMAKSLGDGHRVIRGVAGSGKTLILVYRARLMAQSFPQHRFLLTCYTRSLAGQLREILKEYPNVDVDNLDSIMSDVIRKARLTHPGYKDDDSGDRVAEVALQGLSVGHGPRYHAVFLDEAQDFGTPGLQFAAGLLEPGKDDLVIVADAAQNIFRRKFSWKKAGIQAQGRTRILRTNYRNTREILEFANRFLLASQTLHPEDVPDAEDENAVIQPESTARSGPRPSLKIVDNTREEVEQAFDQVCEWVKLSSEPRQIGLLYSASLDQGVDRPFMLAQKLRAAGIGVFYLSDPRDKSARNRLAQAKEPVVLTSIHSAKGLEFPRVVLCGVWSDREDAEVVRKLAYVGMTRATNSLTVVTRTGHPLLDDLQAAIN